MAINNRFAQSKNYIKEFDDFSKGYQELISIIPEVKLYAGTESNYETVVNRILTTIGDNIPSPKNPNFPNTISFSINSREVGLLTDEKIAFGWKIFFNRETAVHTYQFRVTFLSVSMSKKKYLDNLTSAGWTELEFNSENNNRQTRFWKRLNSPRRNNRSQNYNPRYNNSDKQQNIPEDIASPTEEQLKNLQEKFSNNITTDEPVKNEVPLENTDIQPVEIEVEESVIEQEPVVQEPIEEQEIFSIQKGNLDGGYIITCGNAGTFSINFNSDVYPDGALVDKDNQIIKYNGIVYNCAEGTLYKEEE